MGDKVKRLIQQLSFRNIYTRSMCEIIPIQPSISLKFSFRKIYIGFKYLHSDVGAFSLISEGSSYSMLEGWHYKL